MYRYRVIFIPKGTTGDWRPICIGEPVTLVFHKILTAHLRSIIKLPDIQYAFAQDGVQEAAR